MRNRRGQANGMAFAILSLVIAAFFLVMGVIVIQSMDDTVAFDSTSTSETILTANGTTSTLSQTPSTTPTVTSLNRTYVTFNGRPSDGIYVNDTFTHGATGNFTMIMWVNAEIGKSQQTVFDTYPFVAAIGVGLELNETANNIKILQGSGGENPQCNQLNFTYDFKNKWSMVSLVSNDTWMRLYVNDTLVIDNSTYGESCGIGFSGSSSLCLGANGGSAGCSGATLNGSVDEFRAYYRNLSQAEITSIYSSGRQANTSLTTQDIAIWIPLNENTGTPNVFFNTSSIVNFTEGKDGNWTNDGVNNTLTLNLDYNHTERNVAVLNDNLAWSQLTATYDYNTLGEAKQDINATVVGLSSFADFWEIIVLAVVVSILIGLILVMFGNRREVR